MPNQTRYNPAEHPKLARKVMLLGATLAELAKFLEVAPATVDRWIAAHAEFKEAVKAGGELADANVAQALYRRAVGFKKRQVKIFQHMGQPVIVPYTEYYPAETLAGIFWMKNRQREKWRDKVDLASDPKNPVSLVLNMTGAPEKPKPAKKGG